MAGRALPVGSWSVEHRLQQPNNGVDQMYDWDFPKAEVIVLSGYARGPFVERNKRRRTLSLVFAET